jgi:hypothetical protein
MSSSEKTWLQTERHPRYQKWSEKEKTGQHSQPTLSQHHLPKPLLDLLSLLPPCPVPLHSLPRQSCFAQLLLCLPKSRPTLLRRTGKLDQVPQTPLQNGNPLPPLLPTMLIFVPMPDLREESMHAAQFLILVAGRGIGAEQRVGCILTRGGPFPICCPWPRIPRAGGSCSFLRPRHCR